MTGLLGETLQPGIVQYFNALKHIDAPCERHHDHALAGGIMRFEQGVALCLIAMIASGCAKKDMPDNPPLLGEWQIEAKLASATHNGWVLSDEDAKLLGLHRLNQSPQALGCFEPEFNNLGNFRQFLPGKFGSDCVGGDIIENRNQLSTAISCKPDLTKNSDMTVRLNGEVGTGEVEIRNTVTETHEDGDRLNFIQLIKLTRLGDCR